LLSTAGDTGASFTEDEMRETSHSDGTVGKAIDLLDEIAALGRPVRFAELLTESSHPKATLYRLLQTLTSQRMLAYDPHDHSYRLGMRLVKLAHAAWAQSSLAPIARPYIDALSKKTGETVHLAQLDHGQVLYVDKRNASRPIDMFSQAGKIGPGYCTGVGKAMLAHLDEKALEEALKRQAFHRHTDKTLTTPDALRAELEEIRKAGIAFDREEHEPKIICVAAPILTGQGRALGALSVTSSTDRHSLEDLAALAPELTQTASHIAGEAASWLFPETGQNGAAGHRT
jgi:IclR family transcriptional regulator, KDG regulon repressor